MTRRWADRNVKRKPCKRCDGVFQPTCGGNVYCVGCAPQARRETHAREQRVWRQKNPRRHAINKANFDLKRYGLTFHDYSRMYELQKGRCAICGTDEPGGRGKTRPLAVDHCHSTDDVRGLLCHRCNGALGMVGDNLGILQKMIEYLREHTL